MIQMNLTTIQTEHGSMDVWDELVVNPGDFDSWNHLYLIHNEYGSLALVFANCESDALDEATDNGNLKSHKVFESDLSEMTEEEKEDLLYCGNASEPYDQANLGMIEIPVPKFSLCKLLQEESK